MLRAAAIAITVITAFTGVMYLRFSGDDTHTVPVVVATGNIAAGTRISAAMVKVIELPEEQAMAGAFSDTEPVVGQVTRVAFAKGQQMTTSKVGIATGDNGLPFFGGGGAGKRAVSLEIEPETAQGEPVIPGDRVDVAIERDGEATMVVENVEVLAVERAVPVMAEETRSQVTVTIAIRPEQAKLLAEALSGGGKISLSRRT